MDRNERFEAWTLCFTINRISFFQEQLDDKVAFCIICKTTYQIRSQAYNSRFASLTARCSAGHEPDSGQKILRYRTAVCPSCDADLALRISLREQRCWEDGCERYLNVRTKLLEGLFEARRLNVDAGTFQRLVSYKAHLQPSY